MSRSSKPPLFSYVIPPQFRLKGPDRILSEADFDLLRITVEDFRFVTREITDELAEVPAEMRSRSTILRRLLSENDLFNVGRIYPPQSELRVTARLLVFEPLHPGIIISCGNYPWANDRLDGIAAEFGVAGVEPTGKDAPWSYRENADVSLSEYLRSLALGIFGTRISRREVIKYIADKKAAHVSDKRKHLYEQALDRAWSGLSITIVSSNGARVQLNVAYLELLPVIEALSESSSINEYIDELERWLTTAQPFFPDHVRPSGLTLPMQPNSRT